MSDIEVAVDNRARLLSAVLAGGAWPAREQARKPHAVHQQAKLTRQFVMPHAAHPAVQAVNAHLAEGGHLGPLFQRVLSCSWPTFEPLEPSPAGSEEQLLTELLTDFYTDTAIAAFFWADHESVWAEAARDLRAILDGSDLPGRLASAAAAPLPPAFVVIPNLAYPALETIVAQTTAALYVILPPPQAWGESPPWPYRDGADWVHTRLCFDTACALLGDSPAARLQAHALTTLYLENAIDPAAAQSYLVRTKKELALPELPAAVEALRS